MIKDNIYGIKLLNNSQIKGYLTNDQIKEEIIKKLDKFDGDFRLYEISSEFANFNFNLLKLISNLFIRIDIKENKGFYYVIAETGALDGLDMSVVLVYNILHYVLIILLKLNFKKYIM